MADAAEKKRLRRLRAARGGILPTTLPAPDGVIDEDDRRHLLDQVVGVVPADPPGPADLDRLALLRASMGGVLPVTLPAPDGTIDEDDRRHLLGQIRRGVAIDPETVWAASAVAASIWTADSVAAAAGWAALPAEDVMVVDAEERRLALLRASMGGVLPVTLPKPGGDIDLADRKHLLGLVAQGDVIAAQGTIWTAVERHDP